MLVPNGFHLGFQLLLRPLHDFNFLDETHNFRIVDDTLLLLLNANDATVPFTLPPEAAEGSADPLRHVAHYIIVTLLGTGGMAEVYLCRLEGAEGFRKKVAP